MALPAAAELSGQRRIVDQTGFSDIDRQQQARLVREHAQWLQRFRVHDNRVIEASDGLRRNLLLKRGDDPAVFQFALLDQFAGRVCKSRGTMRAACRSVGVR